MEQKIYAVGGGQMLEAILKASIEGNTSHSANFYVVDISPERVDYLRNTYQIEASTSLNQGKVLEADIVLLGVRPQDNWSDLLKELAAINNQAQYISIIAGVTIRQLQTASLQKDLPIVRVIPNTLTLTGLGYSGVSVNQFVKKELVSDFLTSFGKVTYIPEEQFDVFTGYGIAGPNYIYNFYLALANAGVLNGLSREQANALALENLKGAVAMLEMTGKHPYELLDANNSAGGVGISAQHELDQSDFSGAIQRAVTAAVKRTSELGGEK
ncbi:pyrroline-5-carboxylate reductase family protein [Vagococcus humatus]|uniref:Pyrroline-5-carboxylate reductase n=1 Tax=Vagococcus humatus TaxID=1889241 RepID=A0A3S0ADN5_9ENTE|nr:pyrroline-5-carboxylate reductase [Vagococcus humatus]RST89372.1 pyrroline-5-carboxylate reductase [Vagococcus humatus]